MFNRRTDTDNMSQSGNLTFRRFRGHSIVKRKVWPGQAMVIIALASLALIAFAGLAIDGGSAYTQRRNAQNAADAAALAATTEMLGPYEQMILVNATDVDGTSTDEANIKNTLATYATSHNIAWTNMHAYYIDDNKQLVTTIEVGNYHGVPWSLGAKGIAVKATSETDAYLMKILGWNKVSATASSSAFMGVDVNDRYTAPLIPISYYTDTVNVLNMQEGSNYQIKSFKDQGFLTFTGDNGASTQSGWMSCGFDPAAVTQAERDAFCGGSGNGGLGPTQHYQCGSDPSTDPDCTQVGAGIQVPYLKVGLGRSGWWIGTTSGTRTSVCGSLSSDVDANGGTKRYLVPIIDEISGGDVHLARIAQFDITTSDISCTPASRMSINGTFRGYYTQPGIGEHGDLRTVSAHAVFLDN